MRVKWACFVTTKKIKKQALHEIFLNPNTNVQQVLQPLFQNKHPLNLLSHLFQRISQPPGQDQQNGKRWSANTYFRISIDYITFSSNIIVELFLKAVYSTMVGWNFQIDGDQITGKYICESKTWKYRFLLMTPWQISLLDSYHHLPDRKCNYPLGNIFCLKRRGEETMSFITKKRFQKFLGLAACYGFHIYVFVMLLFFM